MNTALKEALAARDKFLEDKPHLQKYQQELDALLDKVPEGQRLEVIHQLALEKMMDLQKAMGELLGALNDSTNQR